jgi:hypothetical protein
MISREWGLCSGDADADGSPEVYVLTSTNYPQLFVLSADSLQLSDPFEPELSDRLCGFWPLEQDQLWIVMADLGGGLSVYDPLGNAVVLRDDDFLPRIADCAGVNLDDDEDLEMVVLSDSMLIVYDVGNLTAVGDDCPPPVPRLIALEARPNPFNAVTNLAYFVPHAGPVALAVFSPDGRLVWQRSSFQEPGFHNDFLDAASWPAGVYLVRLEAAGQIRTAKVVGVK